VTVLVVVTLYERMHVWQLLHSDSSDDLVQLQRDGTPDAKETKDDGSDSDDIPLNKGVEERVRRQRQLKKRSKEMEEGRGKKKPRHEVHEITTTRPQASEAEAAAAVASPPPPEPREFALFTVNGSYGDDGEEIGGRVGFGGKVKIEEVVNLYPEGHPFAGLASLVRLPWEEKPLTRRMVSNRKDQKPPYLNPFEFGWNCQVYIVHVSPTNKVLQGLIKEGEYVDHTIHRKNESAHKLFKDARASIYENNTGFFGTERQHLRPRNFA